MQRQGVVSNEVPYNALISACEKGKQPEQALEVFRELLWQSLVPDEVTYNALVGACVKSKQPERARDVF